MKYLYLKIFILQLFFCIVNAQITFENFLPQPFSSLISNDFETVTNSGLDYSDIDNDVLILGKNRNNEESTILYLNVSVAIVFDSVSLPDITEQCQAIPIVPTANNGAVIATADMFFPISTQGTTVVTWSYDDGNGNTATQTQNVIIEDTVAPSLSFYNASEATITSCDTNLIITSPSVSDNCARQSEVLDFDGANDYVDLGSPLLSPTSGSQEHTVEMWVKTSQKNAYTILLSQYGYSALFEYRTVFYINTASNGGNLQFFKGGYVSLSGTTNLLDNQWHHVAMVRENSGALSLYVDGVVEAAGLDTYPYSNTNSLLGGQTLLPNNYYKGVMDEVRIWNSARTQAEITSSYNNILSGSELDLVAYYKFEDGAGSSILSDVSGNSNHGVLINMDPNTDWVSANRSITNVVLTNSYTGTSNASGNYPAGETIVTWTATDSSGNANTLQQTINAGDNEEPVAVTQNLIVELDDSGQASITPLDVDNGSSDNCGIQSIQLDKTTFDCNDIKKNYALNFDGVNDFVVAPYISSTSLNSFTVEAWIKSTTGVNSRIITKPASGRQNYSLMLFGGYPHIRFDKTGGGVQSVQGSFLVNDNQWHHLAGVHDTSNNTIALYVDGFLEGSKTTLGDPVLSTEGLFIGKFSSIYEDLFQGEIDDVRVWNINRSESQINEFMSKPLVGNELGLVAYYNFNEGGNTALTDISINSNNGILTNLETNDWVSGVPAMDNQGVEVVLTVTDINNNTANTTANVIVEDNLAPEIIGKNITVDLTESGTVTILPEDVLESGFDNCGNVTYSLSQDTFTVLDLGIDPITIILTATDSNDNEVSVPVQVMVGLPLSVANESLKRINLYPNPTSLGYFNLEIPLELEDLKITIYNILGEKVFSKNKLEVGKTVLMNTGFTINSGVYFVEFNSKGSKFTKKLIVNN